MIIDHGIILHYFWVQRGVIDSPRVPGQTGTAYTNGGSPDPAGGNERNKKGAAIADWRRRVQDRTEGGENDTRAF